MSEGRESWLYGVLAEFTSVDELVAATREMKGIGLDGLDAYTPFPVEELEEIVAGRQRLLPVLIFLCGMAGLIGGFLMQYWGAVLSFPINVGGRPLNSWPAFIPTCFEIGVLSAVAGGFFLFFAFCRLPRLYHPLWNVPEFARASRDRFFLCVESEDPRFDYGLVRSLLERRGPALLTDVMR